MTEYVVIYEPPVRLGMAIGGGGHSHVRIEAEDEYDAVRKTIGAFNPDGSFWVVPTSALRKIRVETRYDLHADSPEPR